MDVTAKLQIKPGRSVAALAVAGTAGQVPDVVARDVNPLAGPGTAGAVLAFARNRAELDEVAAPAGEAARDGRLAWIAYPKGGRLGTDLNRDVLAALLTARGGAAGAAGGHRRDVVGAAVPPGLRAAGALRGGRWRGRRRPPG